MVKPKPKLVIMKAINKLVCVNLGNSLLFYPYTRSKLINKPKPKSSCRTSSPSWLDPKHDPNELDSIWVLDAIFKCELLNQHMIVSNLDFESFIEAKTPSKILINIWNLINTRPLVT